MGELVPRHVPRFLLLDLVLRVGDQHVIERWVTFTEGMIPGGGVYFGLLLVSIGAEIPDTIQAVAAARHGHGSMAVSSCIGSQNANIGIGLGLPWLLSNLFGSCVRIFGHTNIRTASMFQFGAVGVNSVLLLGAAALECGRRRQWYGFAWLSRTKGCFLLVMYPVMILAYTASTLMNPHGDAAELTCDV